MRGEGHRSFAFLILGLILYAAPALAANEGGIPPGSIITAQDWQDYQRFMSEGMRELFRGNLAWKFPSDMQIKVGPSTHYPLPRHYQQATDQYSSGVRIVELPNGGHTIANYVAGQPFPNPQEPLKGWKILTDLWFRAQPWLECGPDNWIYRKDRFGSTSAVSFILSYRQMTHISAGDMPRTDPASQGVFYSEYLELTSPEEYKYSAQLTIYYDDPARPEDLFLFVPALRRTMRLSSAARCSPVAGTDYGQDDIHLGFNGGIARWTADYRSDGQVLSLVRADRLLFGDLNNYNVAFFPKPIVGNWELRPVYKIDAQRIPSERAGYCYSKRAMYVDRETFNNLWTEDYDMNGRLWKIQMINHLGRAIDGEPFYPETGNYIETLWDVQNQHLTMSVSSGSKGGQWNLANFECESYEGNNFTNANRWNAVQGLSQIMR
ncbi:MAG TPA: DUF1329 domain-containing protein [Candidatus Binataceae bacterium]|nr:DUF1329 domain-containing protein [Candidatus Binataceae bacterium]